MATLTVTGRGQVTFRKDVLEHLGVRPGDKVELDKLPNGSIALRASRPTGTIDDFIGILAGKTTKVATLEEIQKPPQQAGPVSGEGHSDTNILVRLAVQDDPLQTLAAANLIKGAEAIAVSTAALCEFVWVLRTTYRFSRETTATAVQVLLNAANVLADREAAATGLAHLEAGGDFADGVIAYQGRALGGDTFVSFDRKAVSLAQVQGHPARLLT